MGQERVRVAGAVVVRRGEQTVEIWRPGVETRRVVAAATGARTLCVLEQRHQPGRGAPTHRHDVEEAVIVREGQARFWAEGESVRLDAGDAVVVPAGLWHGFVNAGSVPLVVEAVFAAAAPAVVYEEEAEVELEIGRAPAAHRTPRRRPGG